MIRKRFTVNAAVAASILAVVVGLSSPALAARNASPKGGGGGGGSSLALVMVTDRNGDGLPNYGDAVTFRVSTTATAKPEVELDCYQGGVKVYTHSAGFFPDYPWPWSQTFALSSTAWTAGAADCTAILYYVSSKGSFITLTSISVHVNA